MLLLDEPTSALDLRRQLEVLNLVRKVTRERKIITFAALHDLALASRFADRFVLMHKGSIAADGPPEDVLRDAIIGHVYGVKLEIGRNAKGDLMVNAGLVED
ncbi:hypothetical protein [Aminobacter sp. AP02]|uniref:hypothetical protein n=1 Tax=Aminobacter sp. AP02 TaxID=2135737 RepID=UPI000D7B576C|nr:hypothetical protein [Aminobacter sp. AP02]PWK73995.1 hypothetical protein C8K44_104167 [Aminobacter sp. AP02]